MGGARPGGEQCAEGGRRFESEPREEVGAAGDALLKLVGGARSGDGGSAHAGAAGDAGESGIAHVGAGGGAAESGQLGRESGGAKSSAEGEASGRAGENYQEAYGGNARLGYIGDARSGAFESASSDAVGYGRFAERGAQLTTSKEPGDPSAPTVCCLVPRGYWLQLNIP